MFSMKKTPVEINYFAFCRFLGGLNSSLIKFDSASAMHTGVPVSDMNWAFNEKPLNKKNREDIRTIKEYYSRCNLHFEWWVYPCGQSPGTQRMLQETGLEWFTKKTCMVADLNKPLSDACSRHEMEILPVQDIRGLHVWRETSLNGFEISDYAKEPYNRFVASFEIGPQSPLKLFILYFDKQPVSTSILFRHKNTAGIYYVSTLPAYRNKGCGLKITQAAMKEARHNHFKDIVLQSEPSGINVYKRAGFQECCQAEIYKTVSKR